MRLFAPVSLLLITLIFAGCHEPAAPVSLADQAVIELAFLPKDTDKSPDKDPQRLADWIETQTGIETRIHPIQNDGAAIEALRFDRAHAAFLDGAAAWIAWKQYGLQAIAADQRGDGRTYYEAQAWVLADSNITTFEDLRGVRSCHTGLMKSAGMFMPMGYLIGNGFADVVGNPDDINSLRATAEAFFGEASIPEKGQEFYNYDGAFKCLHTGAGDVAFVRDSSYEEHCTDGDNDWCLPRDQLRTLPAFGQVPSHPVMVSPNLDDASRQLLLDALLALNDSDEGRSILEDVLETPGLTAVTTESHLGSYGDAIEHVPGIRAHFQDKHAIA